MSVARLERVLLTKLSQAERIAPLSTTVEEREQAVNPLVARTIAAVGVILAVVSIWTEIFKDAFGGRSETYWNIPHHGSGITILVLAIVAGVGVLLAFTLRSPLFDRLWLLAGTALGGFLLFFPILVTSTSSASHEGAGAWLGATAFLLFLVAGALLPLSAATQAESVTTALGAAVPADWYPDPTGQARLRYWDGATWTDSTSA